MHIKTKKIRTIALPKFMDDGIKTVVGLIKVC